MVMKALADLSCNDHEVVLARRGDVHRGNDLRLRELPNVQLVYREYAWHSEDRRPDVLKRDC